jgi:hypothetical protein
MAPVGDRPVRAARRLVVTVPAVAGPVRPDAMSTRASAGAVPGMTAGATAPGAARPVGAIAPGTAPASSVVVPVGAVMTAPGRGVRTAADRRRAIGTGGTLTRTGTTVVAALGATAAPAAGATVPEMDVARPDRVGMADRAGATGRDGGRVATVSSGGSRAPVVSTGGSPVVTGPTGVRRAPAVSTGGTPAATVSSGASRAPAATTGGSPVATGPTGVGGGVRLTTGASRGPVAATGASPAAGTTGVRRVAAARIDGRVTAPGRPVGRSSGMSRVGIGRTAASRAETDTTIGGGRAPSMTVELPRRTGATTTRGRPRIESPSTPPARTRAGETPQSAAGRTAATIAAGGGTRPTAPVAPAPTGGLRPGVSARTTGRPRARRP